MCGNVRCFWWSLQRDPDVPDPVHIITDSYVTETEAGTEGDVSVAACGEEMFSWYYPGGPEPRFGSLKDAVKNGLEFCEICQGKTGITILSYLKAINQKLPIVTSREGNCKLLDDVCPECGSPVICYYDDVGGFTGYDFNYAHICLNGKCPHFLHERNETGDLGGGPNVPQMVCCPFCHRELFG